MREDDCNCLFVSSVSCGLVGPTLYSRNKSGGRVNSQPAPSRKDHIRTMYKGVYKDEPRELDGELNGSTWSKISEVL